MKTPPSVTPPSVDRPRASDFAAPAPANTAAPESPAAPASERFDSTRPRDASKEAMVSAPGVASAELLKTQAHRPFAMGRDGFVAVDGNGAITGGMPPSARVRERDIHAGPLDPLFDTVAHGEEADVHFQLPDGGDVKLHSDEDGGATLPMNALHGLKPGLNTLQVSTPDGDGDESNVLVLPRDYDGPIFISDIDDTLRATNLGDLVTGKTQEPIAGAKDLLGSVANRGVPIVYLSAGVDRIRPQNEDFLSQLPPGILLDRDHLGLRDVLPFGQASAQGNYKAGVIEQLKKTYPNAQIFGLGDDKYGDALAYTKEGATAYIHDVVPGSANIPKDFHGTITKEYTPEFRAKVDSDLDAAIARSKSFNPAQ
ncbi:MAG TPA: phosphatase domain-containing protein [Myxococcaceae bacterium]|nr:phosphatase domain-containing protein [Myxococcaceae bacterium]